MRVIVADTAPLNYLVVIEAIGILPRLFASVLIPLAVKKELSHGHAPVAVSTWIASPPAWLKVVNLKTSLAPALSYLDIGEAEAITLALEQPGTLLLMDDRTELSKPGSEGWKWSARSQCLIVQQPVVRLTWRCSGGCAPARFDLHFA